LTPPPAKHTLLQYYCTTIAQYTPPPPTPPLNVIHHTILAMAISCNGQPLAHRKGCSRSSKRIPGHPSSVRPIHTLQCNVPESAYPAYRRRIHTLHCNIPEYAYPSSVRRMHTLHFNIPEYAYPSSVRRIDTLECNIPESAYPSSYPRVQHTLAFIRYCHSQSCKIYIAIQGGSGGNNILRNRVGDEGVGGWGAQTEGCLHSILLIRAHKPLSKKISCKGQNIPESSAPRRRR